MHGVAWRGALASPCLTHTSPPPRHTTGLTVQWVLYPDSLKEADPEEVAARRAAAAAAGPQLPKVSVTSKPGELRRAFEAAQGTRGGTAGEGVAAQPAATPGSNTGSQLPAPPPTPAAGPLPESPFFKGGGGMSSMLDD